MIFLSIKLRNIKVIEAQVIIRQGRHINQNVKRHLTITHCSKQTIKMQCDISHLKSFCRDVHSPKATKPNIKSLTAAQSGCTTLFSLIELESWPF